MLATSHFEPINALPLDGSVDQPNAGLIADWRMDSGESLRKAQIIQSDASSRSSAVILADAFSEFIAVSSRLENSYRELQEDVYGLGLELAERNAALNSSLAENERMRMALQQIVDSMPCGVLVVDREGRILMINPESCRMLGLDLKNQREEYCSLQQISAHVGINLDLSRSGESSGDTEQEFRVRDGLSERWLQIRNRRLSSQPQSLQGADQSILIVRDITAQKRAEREREAGRKAMALAEITTMLAHEIRNPLASLELFAELIEQDETRRDEWISNLRAGIRSLSGMVNNVLSFHGSGSLKLGPVPVAALIGNAIQFVQPLADQAEVSLKWLSPDDSTLIQANESALQQVVLNLVSNAIRHTPPGGDVTVSLRTEVTNCKGDAKRSVVLEFSDSGCGIRADQIDNIFNPGFSGSGDTSGLGLAVCDRIMQQHGGRIYARNGMESGAIFTLEFPILELKLVTV